MSNLNFFSSLTNSHLPSIMVNPFKSIYYQKKLLFEGAKKKSSYILYWDSLKNRGESVSKTTRPSNAVIRSIFRYWFMYQKVQSSPNLGLKNIKTVWSQRSQCKGHKAIKTDLCSASGIYFHILLFFSVDLIDLWGKVRREMLSRVKCLVLDVSFLTCHPQISP